MPAALQITLPVSRDSGGDLTYVGDPRFAPLATVSVVAIGRRQRRLRRLLRPRGRRRIDHRWRVRSLGGPMHLRRLRPGAKGPSRIRHHQRLDQHLGPGRNLADEPDRKGPRMGGCHRLRRRRLDLRRLRHHPIGSERRRQLPLPHRRHPQPDAARAPTLPSSACWLGAAASSAGSPAPTSPAPAPASSPAPTSTVTRRSTIVLNDPTNWTASKLDLEWDATRPTAVVARTALFSDADPGRRQSPTHPIPASSRSVTAPSPTSPASQRPCCWPPPPTAPAN